MYGSGVIVVAPDDRGRRWVVPMAQAADLIIVGGDWPGPPPPGRRPRRACRSWCSRPSRPGTSGAARTAARGSSAAPTPTRCTYDDRPRWPAVAAPARRRGGGTAAAHRRPGLRPAAKPGTVHEVLTSSASPPSSLTGPGIRTIPVHLLDLRPGAVPRGRWGDRPGPRDRGDAPARGGAAPTSGSAPRAALPGIDASVRRRIGTLTRHVDGTGGRRRARCLDHVARRGHSSCRRWLSPRSRSSTSLPPGRRSRMPWPIFISRDEHGYFYGLPGGRDGEVPGAVKLGEMGAARSPRRTPATSP